MLKEDARGAGDRTTSRERQGLAGLARGAGQASYGATGGDDVGETHVLLDVTGQRREGRGTGEEQRPPRQTAQPDSSRSNQFCGHHRRE